jgi:HAD superfamily hydrolase (TIGR01509 family)
MAHGGLDACQIDPASDWERTVGGPSSDSRTMSPLRTTPSPVRQPRLVIFDCDGVLIDSERLAIRVEAELLADLGWPLTQAEIVRRFTGRSQKVMFDEIVAQLGDTLPPDWQEIFHTRYQETFAAELRPIDGIVDALDRIDLPSCVASSSTPEQLRFTLGIAGLYDRFEGRIFSATQVKNGKPAPDLFLYAAQQMGFEPSDCVVVEDSVFGVQAARAAGMTVLAYASGLIASELLEGPGTTLFDDMRRLPQLLAPGVT